MAFLLHSALAKRLYRKVERLPIIDYHCHLDAKEIFENKPYKNLTELWLLHDHYKWRLMRLHGIDEKFITGNAPDYEKFCAFLNAIEIAVGNPIYHWCSLELKNFFGYKGALCKKNAQSIWHFTTKALSQKNFTPQALIKKANVAMIGTTDDPLDNLLYHQKLTELNNAGTFATKVCPTFRPDVLLHIQNDDFVPYINKMGTSELCQIEKILEARMDFFAQNACVSADQSFEEIPFAPCTREDAQQILNARLTSATSNLCADDVARFKTYLLTFLAKEYAKRGWVMQLHFGVVRNSNSNAHKSIGINAGFDRTCTSGNIENLAKFLDSLNVQNALPKTILYNLHPSQNEALSVLCGCFCQSGVQAKVQHGSAWWFLDHLVGMQAQLQSTAQSALLAHFVGMLTDSRSILSYARHEYFRRILCNFLAEKKQKEHFALSFDALCTIAQNIAFFNANKFFNLNLSLGEHNK